MESAHRGGLSASSSSAALQRSEVARTYECVCGVACSLQVARDWAVQRNAAVGRAALIGQEEASDQENGIGFGLGRHLSRGHDRSRAGSGGCSQSPARPGGNCQEEGGSEGIGGDPRVQADAAKWDAFETARQKVAKETAKTEVEIRALAAEKGRLQLEGL